MGTSPRHCPAATLPGAESLGRPPSIDTRRPSPRLRSSSLCFSYKEWIQFESTAWRWPAPQRNRYPYSTPLVPPECVDSGARGNPCHTLVPHGKKLLSQCMQIAPPLWPIRNSSPVTGPQICSIRGPFVNPKVRESDRNTWIGPESSLIRQPGYVDSLIVSWVNV